MADFYQFVIDGRPIAKSNMYGARVVGKRAIIYTTRELEDYEMAIGKLAQEVIPQTLTGFQSIYVRVYQHGKKFIDVDNCFKAINDGLDTTKIIKRGKKEIRVCETGIANDKYFQLVIGERIIVEKAEEQRVEITIAPYRGLFDFVNVIKDAYNLKDDYYDDLILFE